MKCRPSEDVCLAHSRPLITERVCADGCRHENTTVRYLASREAMLWQPWNNFAKICADCGEYLSLGPAADESEAVRIEIDAARLAANETAAALSAALFWALLLGPPRAEQTIALAYAIATHDEEQP